MVRSVLIALVLAFTSVGLTAVAAGLAPLPSGPTTVAAVASSAPVESAVGRDSDQRDRLNYLLTRQNAAQSYNDDMAKWILASLILINGAPFYMLTKETPSYAKALRAPAKFFLCGLGLAILCGFAVWLTTGMREEVGSYTVDRLLSSDPALRNVVTPGELWSARTAIASYFSSMLAAFGSLVMFLIGAFSLKATFEPD